MTTDAEDVNPEVERNAKLLAHAYWRGRCGQNLKWMSRISENQWRDQKKLAQALHDDGYTIERRETIRPEERG